MTVSSAKIVCDSINEDGHRLTTMQITLHRFVLAEFNTHRIFSRNSASSRAIPVEKMVGNFLADPALPVVYTAEQPGMQGGAALVGDDLHDAERLLDDIRRYTAHAIRQYLETHPEKSSRLHKGLLNRPMEWAQWHTVVVTSTEWGNFFSQRCSPLAQPEIAATAYLIRDALEASTPIEVEFGDWHTPYIDPDTYLEIIQTHPWGTASEMLCKISAARTARVSYLTQEGIRDYNEDLNLYERLSTADPPHWSPMEHVATPCPDVSAREGAHWQHAGNFTGWDQLRHVGITG